MRMFFASLALASLTVSAVGQVQPKPLTGRLVQKKFDDGEIDSWWKVNNPAGPSDWFNVDFDNTCQSSTALGICMDVWDANGGGELYPKMGLYPDSTAFAGFPDIGAPFTEFSATIASTDGFNDLVQYDLPCIHLGSTDINVAAMNNAGDSASWIGADSNGTIFNRSFATSNNYATAGGPAPFNWTLGLLTDGGAAGTNALRINGGTNAVVNVGETFSICFWGCKTGQTTQLRAFNIPLLPVVFTTTGGILAGPKPETWCLDFTASCALVLGIGIPFQAFYANCPSGVGISNTATLQVVDPNMICAGCYGIQDDGVHEGFFWKIQNPSGASDWFNVNQGTASASTGAGMGGTMMTSVDIGVSEQCGVPGSFVTVGEFRANLGLDITGGTPDLGNGVSVSNAAIPAGHAHSGQYPGFVFDVPDLAINTTDIYHAAVRWAGGDTCVWIASDTDGTDGGAQSCGQPLPNNFSLLSTNFYTTAASAATIANWAMKINWN